MLKFWFFLFAFLSFARAESQTAERILNAFSVGDVNIISSYLDAEVDYCLNDHQRLVSKAEAERNLRQFFSRNKPSNIEPLYKGNTKNSGNFYRIARLTTENGDWKLFLYFESSGNNLIVKEVRLEAMN
jgi:hypothetical protein